MARAITIGEIVPINSSIRASLLANGDAPILRENDTVAAKTANTPVRRLGFCARMMYPKSDIRRYRTSYPGLVRDLRGTIPEFLDPIDPVSDHVSGGSHYKGLKEIRKLMKREEGLPRINA